MEEGELTLPPQAVGYILLNNGSLFSFGVLPPNVEAKVLPGVSSWNEIKLCPTTRVLALPPGQLPLCPADYCKDKVKSHETHARKHLSLILEELRRLRKSGDEEEGGCCDLPSSLKIRYYCSRTLCYSGLPVLDVTRGFSRMKYLRQHYLKLHAPKTFACSHCGKPFSTLGLLGGHMKNCGNSFECSTCQKTYGTLEALQTHCRRNCHVTDFARYKDLIDNAKSEVSALRRADKQRIESNGKSVALLPLPEPVQVIAPRPKTITCGPEGTPSHVIWTYDAAIDNPKVKSETGTQTETELPEKSYYTSTPINAASRRGRRKRSAETQTGKMKNKVSTGAQTLNVTKRRRTSKKQIVEAETQCNTPTVSYIGRNDSDEKSEDSEVLLVSAPATDDGTLREGEVEISLQQLMALVGIDNDQSIKTEQEIQSPEGQEEETTPQEANSLLVSTGVVNVLDQHLTDSNMAQTVSTSEVCVGFDSGYDVLQFEELTRETQTDPSSPSQSFDNLFNNEMYNLVTTETQTSFYGVEDHLDTSSFMLNSSDWNNFNLSSNPLDSSELSQLLSHHEPTGSSPTYLETIDGETQTTFPEEQLIDCVRLSVAPEGLFDPSPDMDME